MATLEWQADNMIMSASSYARNKEKKGTKTKNSSSWDEEESVDQNKGIDRLKVLLTLSTHAWEGYNSRSSLSVGLTADLSGRCITTVERGTNVYKMAI